MSLLRRHADAVLAALLCAAAATEQLIVERHDLGLALVLAALSTLPVAFRRGAPLAALAVVALALATQYVTDVDPQAVGGSLAYLILIFTAAARLELRAALAGLALAYTVIPSAETAEDAFYLGMFILPWWLAGRVLRDRRARIAELERLTAELAEEREERERLAVEAERARIAREMHDILAHAMSLMTVQAGAGERLVRRDPTAAEDAFGAIREAGSSALSDLRRVLGRLRTPGGPEAAIVAQPDQRDFERLAEQMRAAGLHVELHLGVDPSTLPVALALSTFRIVQEATTNTLKHSGAHSMRIALATSDRELRICVEDDGAGAGAHGGPGTRSGLIGMRERAAVHGGVLETGPADAGGYAVRARLPLHEDR